MSSSPTACARQVLETIPLVMHAIRHEMRSQRNSDLSVPQFRILVLLNRHAGSSLSDVADHMGLTLPSVSKMVDGLVARSLVTRQMDQSDRRRVTLSLTPSGQTSMQAAYACTQRQLAARLAALSAPERLSIVQAMTALAKIFGSHRESKAGSGR